jgi:hypothetical protein
MREVFTVMATIYFVVEILVLYHLNVEELDQGQKLEGSGCNEGS